MTVVSNTAQRGRRVSQAVIWAIRWSWSGVAADGQSGRPTGTSPASPSPLNWVIQRRTVGRVALRQFRGRLVQRQQHHHRPRRLAPLARSCARSRSAPLSGPLANTLTDRHPAAASR